MHSVAGSASRIVRVRLYKRCHPLTSIGLVEGTPGADATMSAKWHS